MANKIRHDLIKRVEEDGWYKVAQKGSHMQFKHPTKLGKVTIPYEVTKNIELSVLKQAEIKRK